MRNNVNIKGDNNIVTQDSNKIELSESRKKKFHVRELIGAIIALLTLLVEIIANWNIIIKAL